MKKTILIVLLLCSVVYAADYIVDENMNLLGNDIYNATNINATAFYDDGVLLVDTNTNANTICSGTTTYLDGEGACDDLSNVYINEAGDSTGALSSDLNIDANTLVVDYDTNEVGIGIVDPLARLHVYYPTSGNVIFQAGTGDGGSDIDIKYGYNGYGWYYRYLGSGSGVGNEWQLWSEGYGGAAKQTFGINQDGAIKFFGTLALLTGTTVNDIDITVANNDNALITSGGVFDGLAAQDACSEITGCVVGATTNTGTVTSIATTAPISGGTITSSGTIGLATATPSDGDTTHASTADQIYDWVIGLTYATTTYVNSIGNWSLDSTFYWNTSLDLDTVISDDEITEGKVAFSTACAAGNHYYLNGNDLACEADANTQLSEEQVEDFVGGMLGGTETLITVTYEDTTNDIDFVINNNLHDYSWSNVVDADITNTLTCSNLVAGSAVVDISTESNLAVGTGITLTDDTLTVVGGTAITADVGGVSITGDGIGDTQLAFNTGQHLTTISDPTFNNVTMETIIFEVDPTNHRIYDNASCIFIKAGTTILEICE